jgi:hypothetical protein
VSIFRPSFLFSGARVFDGALYVMYYPLRSDHQQIAILSHGVLHPVTIPGDHWAMTFENGNRVISTVGTGDLREWFEIRGGHAIAIARPASPVYGIPNHALADGDSCSDGLAGTGSALDEIRDHRRVSILADAAMSRATDGAIAKATQVYCDHFHGKNYATMENPGIVFRLDGRNATLFSSGWIEAASERQLLILSKDTFIEAEVRSGSK